MMEERGYSFIEVCIALLLTTSIALALLKQQWQIHREQNELETQIWQRLERYNQREQGMTLLECILGLSLACTLLFFLMQQLVQIKQQSIMLSQSMHQMVRLETILDGIREKGHQAGYTPCLPLRDLRSFDPQTHQPLRALELSEYPFNLLYYYMDSHFVAVSSSSEKNQFVLLEKKITWQPHALLLIADCHHAELIQHYTLKGKRLELATPLHFTYYSPIYIGEWIKEGFNLKRSKKPILRYQYQTHQEALTGDIISIKGSIDTHAQKKWLHLELETRWDKKYPLTVRLFHV